MGENEFGTIGKGAVGIGLAMLLTVVCRNLIAGQVPNPSAFAITLGGFAFFLVAKLSVVCRGHFVSFGVGRMSPQMKNVYRAGWWLMVVGVMATFGP